MGTFPNDYQKLVLDDIRFFSGLNRPVKAGFTERVFRKKLPLSALHPNPGDEFCDPKIGPNFEIVSRYVQDWRNFVRYGQEPEIDRICVEKMSVGGYMILDGHHRWLAAHRSGFSELPVQIMNVTPAEEVLSAVENSERRMCASFDLDEVLLTDPGPLYAGKKLPSPFMKTSMRKNSPALMRELQAAGFDVWVYTGSYMEEEKLQKLFRFNSVHADGIVNGLRNRQTIAQFKKAFAEKYDVSLHIDSSCILCVNTRTKEYDSYDISCSSDEWASRAITAVKQIPLVKARISQES